MCLAAGGLLGSLIGGGRAEAFENLGSWSGAHPPSFTLDDTDRRATALAEYRGRPLILHFFATWCEPCQRELPALAALFGRHQDAGLAVLAISVGEPDIRVRRFVERASSPFPVLLDRDRAVSKGWGADVLPTSILFDRALMPRWIVRGELDWQSPATEAALRELGARDEDSQKQPSKIQGG